MSDRVLDISESPAVLSVRCGNIVVDRESGESASIPLSELAVVVVSNPRVRYSQSVLAALAANGGTFVACDERHTPVGMLLPLAAHSLQAERFALQATASRPTRKRAWQAIVRAKVRAQGRLLATRKGTDLGLSRTALRVRSGDPANVEAQAARLYWPSLLGSGFRRERGAQDVNVHLNYGYAVLRAVVSRAVCAAGLHPSIGVHHHNRYNPFCLADDLMEPYRPIVDAVVHDTVATQGLHAPLDRESRRRLLAVLGARFDCSGEGRTLFDWLARAAASLREVLIDGARDLNLPELGPDAIEA